MSRVEGQLEDEQKTNARLLDDLRAQFYSRYRIPNQEVRHEQRARRRAAGRVREIHPPRDPGSPGAHQTPPGTRHPDGQQALAVRRREVAEVAQHATVLGEAEAKREDDPVAALGDGVLDGGDHERLGAVAQHELAQFGPAGQGPYLNLVVALETDYDSDVLSYWTTDSAYYDVTLSGMLPENDWAIDVTVARLNGQLYAAWSGWEANAVTDRTPQHLYIAPMSDPATISGERRRLSRPEHGWEMSVAAINEGPEVVRHAGSDRLFLLFSADASWTQAYKMGLMEWTGGDVTDPASWRNYDESPGRWPGLLDASGGSGGVRVHDIGLT